MRYALITNNTVENIIEADADFITTVTTAPDPVGDWVAPVYVQTDTACIGWTYNGTAFTAPTVEAPPSAPVLRHITRLAFISRFTDAEAIAIDLASIGATPQAATMRRYQAKVDAAKFIDLDRADTRAGVQALEAAGLLASGRAAVILDTAISDAEKP